MKNFVNLIIFTIIFSSSLAQEKFIEYSLGSNAINNTNYSYKIYFSTEEGVYYYNKKAIETDHVPSIKISPLGNEVFMVLDKEIGLYDATYFKMLKETKNPLRDFIITDIIPDTFGEIFYLITSNGALYESRVSEKKMDVLKKPLNMFVSQGTWNSNLNSLLLADDFYLFYYNPISGEEKERVKMPADITSLFVDTINFKVYVGLSSGEIKILSQDLSQEINTLKVSKNSISAISKDPLDHYLFIGDYNGSIMTVDLLKEKTINTIEKHLGKVKLGDIYDRLAKRKFIVSSGYDKTITVHETTNLEPNYRRVIEEILGYRKNNFIKKGLNESAVAYDKRVTEVSIKTFSNETISSLVDSIAKTKAVKSPVFKLDGDSLNVLQEPFPAIKLKLYKPIDNPKELDVTEIHYALEKDNTFSIADLVLNHPKGPIKYSSDKRKMLQYEEEISIEMAKEVAKKEQEFKKTLSDLVTGLRSEGKLNDVELSVASVLKKEKDSLGNDELNLHVTFVSQGIKAEIEKETADYKAGKYDIFESVAATTLVDFFIESTSNKLQEYLSPGTKITFKLTGSTDKSKITTALPYSEEYGAFKNFPYYFQGQLAGLNLNKDTGIESNSQLGFLRTYSVRNFIENFTDVFEETKRKYIHYSEESDQFGPEHRRIKIEMVIHKVSELPKVTNQKTERPLSEVDMNIPKGKQTNGYALVIGNEDYSSFQRNVSKESDVPYAVRDGETFSNYLTQMFGFEKDNVDFLRNATYGEMSQAISRLERLMDLDGEGKDIVVFYSGHGMPEENTKEPYLIPVDINGMNVSQGISLKDLMKRLSERPHGNITLVVDACFSGLGKVEPLSSVKGITVVPVNPELGENMLLLSSSSGNESSVVDDKNQHGLFTYHLLKILKETQGEIPVNELYERLKKEVGLSAIKNLDKVQTPSILIGNKLKEKLATKSLIGNE